MSAKFELQIKNQHWLGDPPDQIHDGCSHGGIRAVVGGIVITSDEAEYGISQSALSLLRTLEADHCPAERVSAGYLLCHGCGYPVSFGCGNFGTDWVVRHEDGGVFLSQPSHFEPSGETEFDVRVHVPIGHYRTQVVAFAETARDFFSRARPRQVEDWEQDLHEQFWAEFEARLERANAEATATNRPA